MKKHIDYVNSIANELMEAEIIVKSIKHSKEWKSAMNYFSTCCYRGNIKERPSEQNDYKIIVTNPSHQLNSKYMDYFTKAVPILLKAEKIVHEIKRSEQWKETQCYCNTLVRRGKIKACPSFKNGYTIEKLPENNSSKSWKKLFEEQKQMSMVAKNAFQKRVFSFRATIGNISVWKAYATACGRTMEEIGNDAMDFYIKRHKLTETERTVFNALMAKNTNK